MIVIDINSSGGAFATVSATVGGVRCDVFREAGELVLRTSADLKELARGSAVPTELVAAYESAAKESAEYHATNVAAIERLRRRG